VQRAPSQRVAAAVVKNENQRHPQPTYHHPSCRDPTPPTRGSQILYDVDLAKSLLMLIFEEEKNSTSILVKEKYRGPFASHHEARLHLDR
jgi:hypothetical protein